MCAVCAKEISVRMAPKLTWPLFLLLQHELEHHVPQPLPVHHQELSPVDELLVTVPQRAVTAIYELEAVEHGKCSSHKHRDIFNFLGRNLMKLRTFGRTRAHKSPAHIRATSPQGEHRLFE